MRDSCYSPNCENSDAAIFEAVSKQLEALGATVYPFREHSLKSKFVTLQSLKSILSL